MASALPVPSMLPLPSRTRSSAPAGRVTLLLSYIVTLPLTVLPASELSGALGWSTLRSTRSPVTLFPVMEV